MIGSFQKTGSAFTRRLAELDLTICYMHQHYYSVI